MSPEDLEARVAVLEAQILHVRRLVSDHAQRFDTLQTPPWRRVWWWIRWGWSLVDLNQPQPAWRPWNRRRLRGPAPPRMRRRWHRGD